MLLRLHMVDLTQYKAFRYYPMKDIGEDCFVPVKQATKEPVMYKNFMVFGIKDVQRDSKYWHEEEDYVAEFDAAIEAAAYTMALDAALEGRSLS